MKEKMQFTGYILILASGLLVQSAIASTTMSESDISKVEKQEVRDEAKRKQLQQVAVTLASYEFEASKLIDMVDEKKSRNTIDGQAEKLIALSENVLDWARFRLVQCEAYLVKSLELKGKLDTISHSSLESDYHHDGVLPEAPPECYHIKDMFIHPATVLVLTRDDPDIREETRNSIKSEITEVLAHTEVVRQLVIY